jgi:hypothetical protein
VFCLVFLLIGLWPLTQPEPAPPAAKLETQKTAGSDATNIPAPKGAADSKQSVGKPESDSTAQPDSMPKGQPPEPATSGQRAYSGQAGNTQVFLGVSLPREIDFLFLVLIAGALGAFLHSARSFTAFAGEGTLKSSWMWWYWLHPFLGAALALAFYLAVRGGFLVVATGAVKTSDLNPFAIVALG